VDNHLSIQINAHNKIANNNWNIIQVSVIINIFNNKGGLLIKGTLNLYLI